MKRVVFFSSIILFVSVLSLSIFFYVQSLPPQKSNSTTVKIFVENGRTIKSVASELKEKNIIKNKSVFYLAARFWGLRFFLTGDFGSAKKFSLKTGTYEMSQNFSYKKIFSLLASGQDSYVKVTVPEGYSISMIAKLLEENNVCNFSDFYNVAHDKEFVNLFGIDSVSFEGYLFPDTYFFSENMSAEKVIEMMVNNFFVRTKELGIFENDEALTREKLQEIVTLASIVEREYRLAEEAPLIASVFRNRIEKKMGLYSCATIVYIITEIEGKPHPERITYADLEKDSPYNTYRWAALPPTPISNPGIVALKAAAFPAKTNYFYFRVSNPEKGSHVFTTNFDEHVSEGNFYTKKVR